MEQNNQLLSIGTIFFSLCWFDLGPVSTRDNRVLNGPLGRSLRSFARTAHSLRSLPRGTVVINENVFTL